MASSFRWAAWNLTPDDWHRSQTRESATEVAQYRREGTVLTLLSMHRIGHMTPGR
jgi:hypothetical protein